MENLTIRAFRAIDDRERCVRYLMEHTRVLEDIGVSTVIKPDISWCMDPQVIVIVAEHDRLGMVAGIRLHKQHADKALPLQDALIQFDPASPEVLARLQADGNGEIAGLWNAHRFAGRGIPKLLLEATISIANQLQLGSMVTFIAEYVAPYVAKAGFTMMEDLRDGGNYIYPVSSIRTHAMILKDPLTLSNAAAHERRRIMSLRMRPGQSRAEKPKWAELAVRYDLIVDASMSMNYNEVSRWWNDKAA